MITKRSLLLWLALDAACSSHDATVDHEPSGGDDSASQGAKVDAGTHDAAGTRSDAKAPTTTKTDGSVTREPEACGKADVTITRVIPRVWLLIDGSGSMAAPLAGLGGPSRFAVLRDALLNKDTGLVAKLAESVAFGLMVYDGGTSPPGVYVEGVCPRVIVVEPALDNYAAIDGAYPAGPTGASTPTHYALLDLQMRIQKAMSSDPSFVLLATDGKPNLCDFHDGVPASAATEREAVATVAQLEQAGTKTFALSMAGGDPELQAHLAAVAAAGGTGADVFTPTSQGALVDALTQIFGGTQSCDVTVEGTIVSGKECSGDVALNERALRCDDDYKVLDDHKTIELQGDTCKALQQNPESKLRASFDCNDVILL
jgi:hypothetical protein